MRYPILAALLAAVALTGCDTLRSARTGAADLALGEATTWECRGVRAEALTAELAALWPGREWSEVEAAAQAYGPERVDLASDWYVQRLYAELVPVLSLHGIDVGRAIIDDGLPAVMDAARDVPEVAEAIASVRAAVAECEAET